jgi:predicted DNA binding CopG/RHH family protein
MKNRDKLSYMDRELDMYDHEQPFPDDLWEDIKNAWEEYITPRTKEELDKRVFMTFEEFLRENNPHLLERILEVRETL